MSLQIRISWRSHDNLRSRAFFTKPHLHRNHQYPVEWIFSQSTNSRDTQLVELVYEIDCAMSKSLQSDYIIPSSKLRKNKKKYNLVYGI